MIQHPSAAIPRDDAPTPSEAEHRCGAGGCGCPRRQGGRMRRGWVREAMLALLTERPMHGYEMITELARRTTGTWRPSPGSVYPALQALEGEGLVTSTQVGGRRSYELTDAGRRHAGRAGAPSPWQERPPIADPASAQVREALELLLGAVDQALAAGTDAQRGRVAETLVRARREVFAALAEAD